MQRAEKLALGFRFLPNYDFKRAHKNRLLSGRSGKSVLSRKSAQRVQHELDEEAAHAWPRLWS